MLSSPIVIHVQRPYPSEDEYLAHERFSIDAKSMLLIGQPELPTDTAVVFDIQLANGHKPIRAEAKVIGYVPASDEQPAGLRVRFKRFGAATKAFIDRALAAPVLPSPAPIATATAAPVVEAAQTVPSEVAIPNSDASGVHRKVVLPVSAPVNRDALLARLRGRRAS